MPERIAFYVGYTQRHLPLLFPVVCSLFYGGYLGYTLKLSKSNSEIIAL